MSTRLVLLFLFLSSPDLRSNLALATFQEVQKLVPSDPVSGSLYGFRSNAISGNTVLTDRGTSRPCHEKGANSGSVYVYANAGSSWTLQAKLTAPDTKAEDRFGYCVTFHTETNDKILIGAIRGDGIVNGTGCVYEFTRSGSTWEASPNKLFANDGQYADNVGAVAMDGNTAVVGASTFSSRNGPRPSGGAYVFTLSSGIWAQQAALFPSDALKTDNVGFSVAISGETIVMGSALSNSMGNFAPEGVAYVYFGSGDTWVRQARLVPDYPQLDWIFGYQVAVWGDTLAIGGFGRAKRAVVRGGVISQGAGHVYRRSNGKWSSTANLRMPRPNLFALGLGSNGLALRNDTLLASLIFDSLNKGAVAVYRSPDGGVTWKLDQQVQASDAQSGAFGLGEPTVFGAAVAF